MHVCLSLSDCLFLPLFSALDMVAFTPVLPLNPGGFADLNALGNCSCFMYQKAAPCRSSDTSYLHCPFKSAKGPQKGNSCSCQRVSRVTLITLFLSVLLYLLVFVSVVTGLATCCFCFLCFFAWCVKSWTHAFHAKGNTSSLLML